ncbi:MAG: uroporphyrinogen decarboxylase family protein, partial [Caldimonas sp.]
INAEAVALYLNAQIDAGAQAVMIFDSWGGVLADGVFQKFSLAYTGQVLKRLKRDADGRRVPHIVFTKGGGPWLEAIGQLGADVVGVDWTVNLGAARSRVGTGIALQGNLDPNVLFAEADAIRSEVAAVLASFHGQPTTGRNGHVFNLGHGISQHTPPEHVSVLVDAVHELSRAHHSPNSA